MKRLLLCVVGIVAIAAAACGGGNGGGGGGGSASDINTNATLVVGDNLTGSGFSQRLQPDLSTSVCDYAWQSPVFSTLVYLNPNTGDTKPGLAESWKVIDSRTVQFKLRANLTFQDGTKLDATAAKAGLDKNRAGRLASTMGEIDSITVDDPVTFTVKLKSDSSAILPVTLAGREGEIAAASSTDTKPIGAGPFKFVSQIVGQEINYEKFDGYWDAKNVKIAKVKAVNNGTGASNGLNSLQSGEIDLMFVASPADNKQVQGDPNIKIASRPALTYYKLNVNTSRGPWANLKFRQAMNYAVDRKAISDVLFGQGNYEVAWMPFPSWFTKAYDKDLANKYPYDVNKAKQLIQESGLPTPIKTNAMYPAGAANWQQFAEIVQQQMKAVGVDLTLVPSTDMVREYLTNHQADFSFILWPPRPDPTVTIQRQFGEKQLNNTGNFTNPDLTKAIDTMRGSTDEKAVRSAFVTADEVVVNNALEVPIGFPNVTWPHRTWVTGDFRMYESCQGIDLTTLTVTTDKK